jgi:hypothetical protein
MRVTSLAPQASGVAPASLNVLRCILQAEIPTLEGFKPPAFVFGRNVRSRAVVLVPTNPSGIGATPLVLSEVRGIR